MSNAPLVVDLQFVSKADGFNIYEHGGKFYAMTAGDPKFCLEADTEDAARQKGTDALAAYGRLGTLP